MEFKDMLQIIGKKFFIVAVSTIFFVFISALFSFFILTSEYEATTKIYIGEQETDKQYMYQTFLINTQLVTDYKELVKTREILQRVIQDLELEAITLSELKSKIDVNFIKGTRFIEIKIRDKDPQTAAEIANCLAQEVIIEANKIMGIINASITEEAVPETMPVSPKHFMNIILGIFLGIFIGVSGVLIVEYLSPTVLSANDVLENTELSVLGVIPQISKASKTGENQKSNNMYNYNAHIMERYRILSTNINFLSKTLKKEVKSILITSPMPQEGKSITVSNLGVIEAAREKTVLILNFDLRKTEDNALVKNKGKGGLKEFLEGKKVIEEVEQKTDFNNLTIVSSGQEINDLINTLNYTKIKELIDKLLERYDLVILDSPPVNFVADSIQLSNCVDAVVLVAREKKTKLKDLKQAIEALKRAGANILGIVINYSTEGFAKEYYYYGYGNKDKQKTKKLWSSFKNSSRKGEKKR